MQVMFAKWDDILAIREVPETARGNCPFGGLPYATAVYHYARALALAAKAEGAAQCGARGEGQRLKGLAETSLALLRVCALPACHVSWCTGIRNVVHSPQTLQHCMHAAEAQVLLTPQKRVLPVGGGGKDPRSRAHCARAAARCSLPTRF